ncbi:hypothetical protein BOX15_Mlig009275g1 [Macrostomum lignano]|uniref:Protein regulator of cytokinesis 1 n=1 Tax=Macrostomum lignano TaxID=282301 RepID=A0A267DIE0_9PLAT|nr:hypothetical protein BOX15_Mlig009275g1 [Macrostomum lignano]
MRKEIILDVIEPGLGELESIWDYIGYPDEQRTERLHTLAEQLQARMFDFISAENQRRVQLDTEIEARKRRAAQICQTLRLPPYFPPRGLPSLSLLEHLDAHIAQFEADIKERQARQSELTAQVRSLCERLGLPDETATTKPAEATTTDGDGVDSTTDADDAIPSEQDLERLQSRVAELERRRDDMLKRLSGLAEDVRRIALDIEFAGSPAGSGADDAAQALEDAVLAGEETTRLPLSDATLSQLEALRLRLVKHKAMLVGTCDELRQHIRVMWTRLDIPHEEQEAFLAQHAGYRQSTLDALQEESDKCQELKWSQATAYLANLRREASELRATCFLDDTGDEADEDATLIGGDLDDTEEGVAALERRIDELRESYEKNRELYAAVGLYQDTWRAYLDVEQRMKDPAILSNRGGVLLKTDKERKQLQKELPKVEKKVSELLQKLQGGDNFRIRGRTFEQHVRHLWDSLRSEQEASKFNRKAGAVAGGRTGSATSGGGDDLRSSQSPMRDSSLGAAGSPRKSLSATGKR